MAPFLAQIEQIESVLEPIRQNAGLFGQAMLVVALLAGLVLLLMGRRLIRTACAVGGLVLGGLLIGALTIHVLNAPQYVLFGLIGGAVVCCLLAWFLYRMWMGLSCAILLAMLSPMATIIIQGKTEAVSTQIESLKQDNPYAEIEKPNLAALNPDALDQETREELWRQLQALWGPIGDRVSAMWEQLDTSGRTTVLIAAGVGALLGLLFGLIAPNGAAMLQSAAVGAMLILIGALGLAFIHLPDAMAKLNLSERIILVLLGLITLHGVGIQWTLFGRKVDKKA